jgi:hypothetical protein
VLAEACGTDRLKWNVPFKGCQNKLEDTERGRRSKIHRLHEILNRLLMLFVLRGPDITTRFTVLNMRMLKLTWSCMCGKGMNICDTSGYYLMTML